VVIGNSDQLGVSKAKSFLRKDYETRVAFPEELLGVQKIHPCSRRGGYGMLPSIRPLQFKKALSPFTREKEF